MLTQQVLGWPSYKSTELFTVVIQDGAVLAVLLAFAGKLKQMARDWRLPSTQDYLVKLASAFLVTAVGGWVLKQLGLRLPESIAPVAWATLLGGVVILVAEHLLRGKPGKTEISWAIAIAVGGAQLLAAAFPGTSRSGAAIIIALALGASRPAATEFSFLVGVPTLLAAGGYELISVLRHPEEAHEPWSFIILGSAVATVTAFIAVKWLLRFVQSHTFILFGWYRVALGGLILLVLAYQYYIG